MDHPNVNKDQNGKDQTGSRVVMAPDRACHRGSRVRFRLGVATEGPLLMER